MPQMAPIKWLTLFTYFFFIFIIFNILNYFSYNSENPNLKKNKTTFFTPPLFWKW